MDDTDALAIEWGMKNVGINMTIDVGLEANPNNDTTKILKQTVYPQMVNVNIGEFVERSSVIGPTNTVLLKEGMNTLLW